MSKALVTISRANCVPLVTNLIFAIKYQDNKTPVAIFSFAKYETCSSKISRAFCVSPLSFSILARSVFKIFLVNVSFELLANATTLNNSLYKLE